jgi:hypothetical protein
MVNMDKRIALESAKGAAATVIDGGGNPWILVSLTVDGTVQVGYGVVENDATQAACASPAGLKTLQLSDFSGVSTP